MTHEPQNASTTTTPTTPLLLAGPEVCELLSIGLSTLYAMDRSGELGPMGVKLRGRRLWPRRELSAWVDAGCPHREKWLGLWERRQSA